MITQKTNSEIKKNHCFPDSAHQAQLEQHQGHIQLDENFPDHGAYGNLTYDIPDNYMMSHIGINDPKNQKANQKNENVKKLCFLIGKTNLKKFNQNVI